MTENTFYTCDVCGTNFNIKSQCEECENSHYTDAEITEKKYKSMKEFPKYITLTFAKPDGTKVNKTYSLQDNEYHPHPFPVLLNDSPFGSIVANNNDTDCRIK